MNGWNIKEIILSNESKYLCRCLNWNRVIGKIFKFIVQIYPISTDGFSVQICWWTISVRCGIGLVWIRCLISRSGINCLFSVSERLSQVNIFSVWWHSRSLSLHNKTANNMQIKSNDKHALKHNITLSLKSNKRGITDRLFQNTKIHSFSPDNLYICNKRFLSLYNFHNLIFTKNYTFSYKT